MEAPKGPNSFVFTHISTEKCLHQRFTSPQIGSTPPTGNPGSAPDTHICGIMHRKFVYVDLPMCMHFDMHPVCAVTPSHLNLSSTHWYHFYTLLC